MHFESIQAVNPSLERATKATATVGSGPEPSAAVFEQAGRGISRALAYAL